jgi:tRNA-dihydrouridine synthase B
MDFTGKKLFLAPMAGVSDSVFRRICRERGADVVVSEMVSAEGLHYRSAATGSLLQFDELERPIGIQLFGARPERLAEAAEHIQKTVAPDFVDLNAGCPVGKVVKKNGGASLLKDLRLFSQLVRALVKAVSLPVTVKMRSGWAENAWVDIEFAQAAEDCGASAIVLHPRSKTMGFSGHSYWERIALVKKAVRIPVVGNGDIVSERDAARMFDETGCDSVMVGRGALGNAWIFCRIKDFLAGRPMCVPDASERVAAACEHIRRCREAYGERKSAADMKKHASWYVRGLPQSSAVRSAIFAAKTSLEIEQALQRLLPAK